MVISFSFWVLELKRVAVVVQVRLPNARTNRRVKYGASRGPLVDWLGRHHKGQYRGDPNTSNSGRFRVRRVRQKELMAWS